MGKGRGLTMVRWAPVLSAIAELIGILAIVLGFSLIAPWLGWIVGGFGLIVLGQAIDPSPMSVRWPRRKPREGS